MLAFFTMNHWEWIAILVVALLLFGHRLPGMARSLGSGITEFKRGLKEGADKSAGGKPGEGGAADDASGGKSGGTGQ